MNLRWKFYTIYDYSKKEELDKKIEMIRQKIRSYKEGTDELATKVEKWKKKVDDFVWEAKKYIQKQQEASK